MGHVWQALFMCNPPLLDRARKHIRRIHYFHAIEHSKISYVRPRCRAVTHSLGGGFLGGSNASGVPSAAWRSRMARIRSSKFALPLPEMALRA